MPEHKFAQKAHLKSRKIIGQLFKIGSSFGMYPLRAVWLEGEQQAGNSPLQMAMSVPKKKFPRAVDRNRLRRQVREAYRLHKHRLEEILPPDQPPIALMILYTAVEKLPYEVIETAMIRMLKRLGKQLGTPPVSEQDSGVV